MAQTAVSKYESVWKLKAASCAKVCKCLIDR